MGVKKRARKAWSNQAGQMTVELAVAFPVVVAVAVIAMTVSYTHLGARSRLPFGAGANGA